MRVLLDSNILLRMAEPTHVLHSVTMDAVESLRDSGHELMIVPQNIYEFWNVATRSITKNGLNMPLAEANGYIGDFAEVFVLLRDERFIYEAWRELVVQHQIRGVRNYDARLAAAMLCYGISHMLTFDVEDFRQFSHVQILDPNSLARLRAVSL